MKRKQTTTLPSTSAPNTANNGNIGVTFSIEETSSSSALRNHTLDDDFPLNKGTASSSATRGSSGGTTSVSIPSRPDVTYEDFEHLTPTEIYDSFFEKVK